MAEEPSIQPAVAPPPPPKQETVFSGVIESGPTVEELETEAELRSFLVRVYGWMTVGLVLTAVVALMLANNSEALGLTTRHALLLKVLFSLEVVSVPFLAANIEKLDVTMATIVFILYAMLNGLTFAMFFSYLPAEAVAVAFILAAATFGIMTLYGARSGKDLGSLENYGLMMLVGFGVMTLVNFAFGSPGEQWATSFFAIIVFVGLTGYHSHFIRELYFAFEDDNERRTKGAVTGALLLYLDFVNLYILVMDLIHRWRRMAH